MKKISLWASKHPWQSRFLIVLIYLALNFIGLVAGDVLFSSHLIIPADSIYVTSIIFLLAILLYPQKKNKHRYTNFYKRQKLTDFILASTSFLLIISFGNHYNTTHPLTNSPFHSLYAIANSPVPATVLPFKHFTKEKPVIKKKKGIKNLKQKLRDNIRLLRKEYKSSTNGEKTALIVLAILVAAGLLLLLAALACNISCAGSEGAAVVVALLGTGLIIFLLVRVIKRLKRGKAKEEISATSMTG